MAVVAVRVTAVPELKFAVQFAVQLIPLGLLVTVPEPVPEKFRVSVTGGGPEVANVAVTEEFADRVTTQVVEVPVHAPDHPEKVEFAAGVSVSVTLVPEARLVLQLVPQLIPDGLLVTVPVPVPDNATLKLKSLGAFGLKVAVTEVFWLIVTTQDPVPLQAPFHPANVELESADAVSVTWVPVLKVALQVLPQLMPPGVLLIVPVPVPLIATLN